MSRWNIVNVIYFSKNNKRKILEFAPNDVTIITGASNTGKSAIINTIDYCLGSSNCNIASFVLERTTHASTKWSNGTTEFLLSREINGSHKGSSRMYIDYGSNVEIPLNGSLLSGRGTKDQIRSVVERLFGFKEVNDSDLKVKNNRITLRQLVPFMYLDKSVIDSDRILFHGLDDSRRSKFIIEALPYFLGAVTKEEMNALRKLQGLKKGLDNEEKRKLLFQSQEKSVVDKALSLLKEAIQYEIIPKKPFPVEKDDVFTFLNLILNWQPAKLILEDKESQDRLSKEQSVIIYKINELKRKRNALKYENTKKVDYNNVLSSQKAKLDVNKYFLNDESKCPICSSSLSNSIEANDHIRNAFNEISMETKMLEGNSPDLQKYIHDVDLQISSQKGKLTNVSSELESLIKRSSESKKINDNNVLANRVIGRISYFLENQKDIQSFDNTKIQQYGNEIDDLNKQFGNEYRTERIALAERNISTLASDNFEKLPRGVPCENSTINFFSKEPKIVLYDKDQNKDYQFANIGSDENYLSIHLALAFAMQKFFAKNESPVPGILFLDQVSRPYYPGDGESDEFEVSDESDDAGALKKHFDFIFNQVKENEGLQVIILEHAYLKNSAKFVSSTKYRWPKNCSEKLIPSDWPNN